MESLAQLYYLHGIGYEYTKYTGEQVFFSEQTRSQALQCCGIDVTNEETIAALNFALDAETWMQLVPATSLVDATTPQLKVRIDARLLSYSCNVTLPNLGINTQITQLSNLVVVGDYVFNDITYLELLVPLPTLTVGYHDAYVEVAEQVCATQIWATPRQCYQVADVKRLGLSIQLYSLKNNAGLGIGDFTDLTALIKQSAQCGVDYILLNPLHLLFAQQPERASPYSPNSRSLLNPLYIAIMASDDAVANQALTECLAHATTNSLMAAVKDCQYIDYTAVSQLKYQLLRCLYEHFCHFADDTRRQQFTHFCQQHQHSLNTLEVDDLAFASYLQWQAHSQLSACQQLAREQGMGIGLINDLAVGCAQDGSEFSSQAELFTEHANIGAPPDPWAEQGQNWGLPALNPLKLSTNNFAFYRSLIRTNMEGVGGLRIDHVMAIRRLWWCFENQGQQDGCYVYYPFEYLLAILKIESHLNQCIVIGEDLGVVPNEVRTALQDSAIFANSLFYFEKDQYGEFVNSSAFAGQRLLMIANHDVPPFCGWWHCTDLKIKVDYGLIEQAQCERLIQARADEKQRLLRFIERESGVNLQLDSDDFRVYQSLALCLANAPARLFTLQLDDLDQQVLPVNIPGTDKEYPNWRRVLSSQSGDIFTRQQSFLANIISARKN
ncbi:4-alpha-glucanotransferase [Pseudoalteromonas mariniglutinosa]|uniref:4-alpha-glucanotransferase n=1 Tax=Pseudoalteromonas mariniglutinosa TaxID=206042 RepID=UPI00384D1D3D